MEIALRLPNPYPPTEAQHRRKPRKRRDHTQTRTHTMKMTKRLLLALLASSSPALVFFRKAFAFDVILPVYVWWWPMLKHFEVNRRRKQSRHFFRIVFPDIQAHTRIFGIVCSTIRSSGYGPALGIVGWTDWACIARSEFTPFLLTLLLPPYMSHFHTFTPHTDRTQ